MFTEHAKLRAEELGVADCEAAKWLTMRRWREANPGDELAKDVRAKLTAEPERYAAYTREYLGWGVFALMRERMFKPCNHALCDQRLRKESVDRRGAVLESREALLVVVCSLFQSPRFWRIWGSPRSASP